MAGKKKESATAPQKWEDVPEIPKEEQPYPLPDGWRWVNLLNSFHNKTDSKKKLQQKCYSEIGKFAVVDQGKDLIGGYSDDNYLVYNGDLPVIIFGDHTRCIKYVDFKFIQGADGIKVLLPKKNILPKYFFYALQNIQFPDLGYRRHFPIFKNFYIPVAPVETQQRIISRIESLFSKLDEAAEKVQTVIDSHEARKQAILHKAFSGELTRDVEIKEDDLYKEIPEIPKEGQPYLLPEGWKWVKGKDIFSNGGNTSPKGDFFKYIDIESIDNTKQVVSYSKKIAVDDAPSRAKRKLADGDTIFSMVRPYLRNIAYIDETLSSCIASTGFYVCRPNENINSRYLFFLMTSDYVVNGLNKFMRGDNSPSIKPEHIENFAFPLPHKNIQVHIVKIIESNIFCLNNFIELSLLAHEKINHIKKSILNKIFRGEFVT